MLEIAKASAPELVRMIKDRCLSVRELTLHYLDRIAEIDRCEYGLNSVIDINPDVLFLSSELDAKLARGEADGELFGLPVLLKDNINTADKLVTSAGSLALAGNFAPCDAYIAARLRQAGALILGKTNMTEFANYMTHGMPNGYSSRGGQTLNPHNRAKDPSGSSTGSAAAVAADLCVFAVGTETGGSIISPAQQNGVVGLKPTLGLTGRSGIVPISTTLDVAGPMARSVGDTALLLGTIAGKDPDDPATWTIPDGLNTNYTQIPEGEPHHIRIGISLDGLGRMEGAAGIAHTRLVSLLKDAGAEFIDIPEPPYSPCMKEIMLYEFKRAINSYLAALHPSFPMKSLEDIIRFNQNNYFSAMIYGQTNLIMAENSTSGRLVERTYLQAMLEREKAIKNLNSLFDEKNISVILCTGITNIAPFTGFPAMTIPVGRGPDNVPIGSYFIAKPFDETSLFSVCGLAERLLRLDIRPLIVKNR